MIGSILSLILGVTPLVIPVPVVLPVIGLGLGLNGIIKERRKEARRPLVFWLAVAGSVISALTTALVLIGINMHST